MVFGLNWVDFVILASLIFFAIEAFERTFISEFLDLISFVLAFFLSFSFYNFPAKFAQTQFQFPHGLALVFGFIFIWFISETSFYLIIRLFLPKFPFLLFKGYKFLSIFPAVLRGLIFIALFLVIIATFPIQPSIKKDVLNSNLGSKILNYAYGLEAPVRGVFGSVTNESLTFFTIKPQTSESINLGFQTEDVSLDEDSEKKMLDLINSERVKIGLDPLLTDTDLKKIAINHSQDMFKRGYFSHYSPEGATVADRAEKEEIDFLIIGENLAFAPNVELAHKGLMNSEGHRANILSKDYTKLGLGILDGGVYGRIFTQVFSN